MIKRTKALGLAAVLLLTVLMASVAQADPVPSWGHYTYDEGTSGSWLKPMDCLQGRFRFLTFSNPDDGNMFGLQQVTPGYPYPQMYTYQNVAYFVRVQVKNDWCSGPNTAVYTVRTDPGMGNPGTAGWDMVGGSGLSCSLVNTATEKGYNCSFSANAGETVAIRTKHYVGFGSATRSPMVHITLRPADWSAVYHWRNWSYSQVSGP